MCYFSYPHRLSYEFKKPERARARAAAGCYKITVSRDMQSNLGCKTKTITMCHRDSHRQSRWQVFCPLKFSPLPAPLVGMIRTTGKNEENSDDIETGSQFHEIIAIISLLARSAIQRIYDRHGKVERNGKRPKTGTLFPPAFIGRRAMPRRCALATLRQRRFV